MFRCVIELCQSDEVTCMYVCMCVSVCVYVCVCSDSISWGNGLNNDVAFLPSGPVDVHSALEFLKYRREHWGYLSSSVGVCVCIYLLSCKSRFSVFFFFFFFEQSTMIKSNVPWMLFKIFFCKPSLLHNYFAIWLQEFLCFFTNLHPVIWGTMHQLFKVPHCAEIVQYKHNLLYPLTVLYCSK